MLAPMPTAIVMTATAVKAGLFCRARSAARKSDMVVVIAEHRLCQPLRPEEPLEPCRACPLSKRTSPSSGQSWFTTEWGRYGSANATTLLPDGAPFLPPPQAMTMYCRPLMV